MTDAVAKLLERCAHQCLPVLEQKGCGKVANIKDFSSRKISGVWTGSGCIMELKVKSDSGESAMFVAKKIGSYKEVRRESSLVDHMSYYNELSFYETDIPDRMFEAGAICPRPLHVHRHPSGLPDAVKKVAGPQTLTRLERALSLSRVRVPGAEEEQDEGVIFMTKLPGGRWGEQVEEALDWLAKLHALFWGKDRANAAVAQGISDQSCFWHLDTRHLELASMSQSSPLRLAASGLDARLKADAMQTMCHGDPKGANIMWDKELGVLMYDFQWFGKGPCVKDLAYFFATAVFLCRDWNLEDEEAMLKHYHATLSKLLEAQGDTPPSYSYLYDSYIVAVSDYHRWIEGGFPWGDMSLIGYHTKECFKRLHEAGVPKTEAEYTARIFECFPP